MPKRKTNTKSITVKSRLHKHVKLALVPHKANKFHPHVIRYYGIALILVLVMGMQAMYNGIATGNVLGAETHITLTGLLEETNRERANLGLTPLKLSDQLVQAANLKANDMYRQQYWAHTAPDGTTPWQWFAAVDYSYAEAGENLAKNFTSSAGVVSAWMNSKTHRENVVKEDYRDVGFAVVDGKLQGRNTSLVVALYGMPSASVIQGAATQAPKLDQPLSLVARLGLGVQSLTPAAIGSLILLLGSASIAMATYINRKKLPLALQRSWYKHHGFYKTVGFVSLAVLLILSYGSAGQI